MGAPMTSADSMLRRWGVIAVAAVAFLAYYGVWDYGFASDDVAPVHRFMNAGWRAILPYLSLDTGAGNPAGYALGYRPGWILVSYLDYFLWGTWPGGYHITVLLTFVATVVLVWVLAYRVTGDARGATWAGVLFAVLPIHTFTAICIGGRTDGISALGVMGAVVAAVAWRRSGKRRWLVVALAAGLLGLSGKEMGYLLPPLVMVTEWTRLAMSGSERPVRAAFRASLPFWVLVALWGGVVVFGTSYVSMFYWKASLSESVKNWAGAVVLLAYPFDYEPMVQFWLQHETWLVVMAVLTIAAAAGIVYRMWSYSPVRWGLVWAGVTLIPLYRLTMRWYLLLPSVGWCLALAYAVRSAEQKRGAALRLPGLRVHVGTLLGLVALLAYGIGLAGERMKWARADEFTRTALASLVRLVPDEPLSRPLVVTVNPAKLERIPTFGGNTESFVRVASGKDVRIQVVAHAVLDDDDARIVHQWVDVHHLSLAFTPGAGAFFDPHDLLATLRRRRYSVGDTMSSEAGSAQVRTLDAQGRPIALDVEIDPELVGDARWAQFSRGTFQPFEQPSSGTRP